MPTDAIQSKKLNYLGFYVLTGISVLTLCYSAVKINSVLIRQSLNFNMHLRYQAANDRFRQGTDTLTDSVRFYVQTMKPEYMEAYFKEAEVDRNRDQALEMCSSLDVDLSLKVALLDAMRASKRLMNTEYHAMHLIADSDGSETCHPEVNDYPLTPDERLSSLQQHHVMAQDLLWNDSYIETKTEIYGHLARGIEMASNSATLRHLALRRSLFRLLYVWGASLCTLLMTVFSFIIYRHSLHERMLEAQAKEIATMNAQLREERDKSIKAEKAKSYFFSSVSHDIRTPLNAIIGFSEMLQLGINDPKEREKALDAIITSGHTLLELINDVLDLSKLEAGKMEIRPVPTDITALVRKVTAAFEAATTRVSICLHTEIQRMPYLRLDPQRIRQILFNLIGNAVKFTTRGYVTVRASYQEGTFLLSVTDTGCGISEENIKKLMSPYVQLQEHDSTTGTGLGLAICKQLAMQMNGALEITSTVGKGSTFSLRVKNVEACSEQESEAYVHAHSRPQTETVLNEALTQMNILVVDDQKLNRNILCSMLARLGIHKVATAANGQEALDALAKAGDVAIVLTDMFMPVMDGEGLVREIRKRPELARLPVYAITADVEIQDKYKDMGFDNMLVKPITLEKLRNLLAQYAPHEVAADNATADGGANGGDTSAG